MKRFMTITKIESVLFMRNFFCFFFTFIFPVLCLLFYGSIFGNKPSVDFGGLGMMDVSVPAFSGLIIGMTGLMAFPLTISHYKENNVYKRFDATPAGKGCILAVQAFVNFYMAVAGFVLLFLAGIVVYHIHVQGNILLIFMALILSIISIFSLGFFITAIAPDEKISQLLSYLAYFVMIALSGSTFPREMFPDSLKMISKIFPLTYVVDLLQKSFKGAAIRQYTNDILILIVIAVIGIGAGAVLYRKKSWG